VQKTAGIGQRKAARQWVSSTPCALNRLTANSSFTYAYDASGNLTRKKASVSGAATTYNYDSENELTSVVLPGGQTATYKYDALGRRIYRSFGGTTYQYVYDNQDILAIVDQNDNLVALFTHGPGIDEPLEIRQGASGPEYFLHADGLGSIVAVTDGTGNVVERMQYEAYGQPVFLDERGSSPAVESQSFTGSPYAFTGREWDQESGLYYLRARNYDPLTGIFIQQDPIGILGELNFYAYGDESPLNYGDPTGLAPQSFSNCVHQFLVDNYGSTLTNWVISPLSFYSGVNKIIKGVAETTLLKGSVLAALGAVNIYYLEKSFQIFSQPTSNFGLFGIYSRAAATQSALGMAALFNSLKVHGAGFIVLAGIIGSSFATTADYLARRHCQNSMRCP